MMRFLYLLIAVLFCTSCTQREPKHFTNEVLNRMTPVKDQGDTETCWIYAMLATIETEHLAWGGSVNLSPYYLIKMMERESEAPKNQRGELATTLRMMEKYGIVAFDAMPSIDTPAPTWVFMLGATYTPLEFAHSVYKPGEYIQLMCDPRQPYDQEIVLDTPDNWLHDRYLNVPIDTLLTKTERAVREHHGVCWADDSHGMAIVGIAHDDQGEPFFVMKNSWGTDRPHKGLDYVSFSDFKRNTRTLIMTKKAYGFSL